MSAIIIGGNECMGRAYCDLCAKYNITARTIPLKKGSFANQLGKPDYIFVCMDTVSHPLVISAEGGQKARRAVGQAAPRQRVRAGARADPRHRPGVR